MKPPKTCSHCWNEVVLTSNKEMRELRSWCHILFDPIWKSNEISRTELYHKLSHKLGISFKDCHFGHFSKSMLRKALRILQTKDWWIDDESTLQTKNRGN